MRTNNFLMMVNLLVAAVAFTGCNRNGGEVWEDTRSAGRHVNRGVRTMGGKCGDSRQVRNRDDFIVQDENNDQTYAQASNDYVPLTDQEGDNEVAMADINIPAPRTTPGDPGSHIPGIDSFRDPSTDSQLSGVFKIIHFDYNSYMIKGDENVAIVRNIADYMKQHPDTYIFVEGHCDERGPEAYNLALGARRSNAVRNMLVQDGVSYENVFTISYGKERPLVFGDNEEARAQNRRAEFKVYQR